MLQLSDKYCKHFDIPIFFDIPMFLSKKNKYKQKCTSDVILESEHAHVSTIQIVMCNIASTLEPSPMPLLPKVIITRCGLFLSFL